MLGKEVCMSSWEKEKSIVQGLGKGGILQAALSLRCVSNLPPALGTGILGRLAPVVQGFLGQVAAVVLTIPFPTL